MKIAATLVAIVTTVCFAADVAPPDEAEAPEEAAAAPALDTVNEAIDEAVKATREAASDAVRASREAVKQVAQAVKAKRFAIAKGEDAEEGDTWDLQVAGGHGLGFGFATAGRSGTPPLIIRSGETDATILSNIQEDLNVMSRILNKTVEHELGRDAGDSAMGIVLSTLPGGRRPQSMYLENYGALFLVNVKFPLTPAPQKEEDKSEKAADTTWEQTRRELYGQKTTKVWNFNLNDNTAEFDQEQVDSLKKELLESMKNASNIRDVKPDEYITIAVIGNAAPAMPTKVRRAARQGRAEAVIIADTAKVAPRSSTMILRAKKSDVDEFAKGTLESDQFKKRVSVATY